MDNSYYGAPGSASVKMIGERLRELYDPEDFVTVINPDTKPVTYQYTRPSDIETFSDYPGHKNTIQKDTPKRVTLQPGDTKLCPAYEADLMIEAVIKQVAVSRIQDRVDSGELDKRVATADWTDPNFQNQMIKEIFVGKKDILNEYNRPVVDVSKDLELNDAAPRSRKEV
jgi:hypothetical protein